MADLPSSRVVTKIVLPVADMDEAVAFYRRLGFSVESFDPGYAWVTHSGDEILHLRLVEGLDPVANEAVGYLHVRDVAPWHAAWVAAGVEVGDVEDLPWSMREFVVDDPSGNRLRVGANL
ncbi:bleomycin resistance protein [Ilumatobacter sp.]|uniref:bleomycin resistance protein n=1 Tax=Ilumatobacter sp. TaxID=1967498 RepID=UPI003B518623